jgi:hypothetical protein
MSDNLDYKDMIEKLTMMNETVKTMLKDKRTSINTTVKEYDNVLLSMLIYVNELGNNVELLIAKILHLKVVSELDE